MTAENAEKSPITPAQAEVFARGLFYLANVDGIDDREVELIQAFLYEVELPHLLRELPGGTFDLEMTAQVLDTSFLRRVFLRTAIVLVRADGTLSQLELAAIREIAEALGQSEELEELLADTEGMRIE